MRPEHWRQFGGRYDELGRNVCHCGDCRGSNELYPVRQWQGAIEAKVDVLERESAAAINRFDVVGKRLEENSKLLAELNAKLGILLDEHYQRGNHG